MREINRKRLLIVDDSRDIREGLSRFISGIESVEIVGQAGDGTSALEMAEALRPDFVTLDIKMPGISGILVLLELKKRYPGMTVFMLTNFPLEHYKRVCKNAGVDYFFDKTSEFEDMVNTIKVLADSPSVN